MAHKFVRKVAWEAPGFVSINHSMLVLRYRACPPFAGLRGLRVVRGIAGIAGVRGIRGVRGLAGVRGAQLVLPV